MRTKYFVIRPGGYRRDIKINDCGFIFEATSKLWFQDLQGAVAGHIPAPFLSPLVLLLDSALAFNFTISNHVPFLALRPPRDMRHRDGRKSSPFGPEVRHTTTGQQGKF